MFYRQLPAHSPVPSSAFPQLARRLVAANGTDPRDELRALLRVRYGVEDCRLLSSGAHALQVALQIAKRTSHAPILLPAYTCYEVATAAVGAQVDVALYDVDATTLEPNWESVRRSGASGAAALVVAPLYGMPLDWDAARAAAERTGALLIADVAQAHGTSWRGKPAGSVADLIIMSFGRGKGWTGAGGGAVLGRSDLILPEIERRMLTSNGSRRSEEVASVAKAGSQWLLGRPVLYGLPKAIPFLNLGETIYHAPTALRAITQNAACLLLASDSVASAEVLHRRRNAEEYARELSDAKTSVKAVLGARMNADSGALRFPVLVTGGWAKFRQSRASRLGAAGGYPTTLGEIAALRPFLTNAAAKFNDSEMIVRDLITLPTHSQTTASERRGLVQMITT